MRIPLGAKTCIGFVFDPFRIGIRSGARTVGGASLTDGYCLEPLRGDEFVFTRCFEEYVFTTVS